MSSRQAKEKVMENEKTFTCLSCGQPESAAPLITLRYNGSQAWICSQCLPVLIHHPERLADKLDNASRPAALS
jgi:transcription elongation factor Elf1